MTKLDELRSRETEIKEKLMQHMKQRSSTDDLSQWESTRNYLTSELNETQRQISVLDKP